MKVAINPLRPFVLACEHCGIDFHPDPLSRPSRFCSRKCQSARLYVTKHPEMSALKAGKSCAQCDQPVSESMRADAKFCSVRCREVFNYHKVRVVRRIGYHGISQIQYDAMLAAQGGTCAMSGCGLATDINGRALHIDHDHNCCPGVKSCGKCIRGLLCGRHNVGLGMFNDDPAALRAAAAYLEAH